MVMVVGDVSAVDPGVRFVLHCVRRASWCAVLVYDLRSGQIIFQSPVTKVAHAMADPLKSCPFCGEEAFSTKVKHVNTGSQVWCSVICGTAGCLGEDTRDFPNEAQAIDAWNTRKETT